MTNQKNMTIELNPWGAARIAIFTVVTVATGYVFFTQAKEVGIARTNLKNKQEAWKKDHDANYSNKCLVRKLSVTVSDRELEIARLKGEIAQTKRDLKDAQTHLKILLSKERPLENP